jgi:6-phosphofructokinase
VKATVVAKNIGYELRCADPVPFDLEYTRDLGYCAAKYLLVGGNAVMISMQGGHFVPIPFAEMIDPQTGGRRSGWSTSTRPLRHRAALHDPPAQATTSRTRTSWRSSPPP